MKTDVKSEKQKLKKSHKFSAGKKRVGKRARDKYHKRDKRDKSRRRKKNKSRRRKKDKSRRRKKKTRFSAGNKIPATHEETKKLSKAAKAWRKASMDCFAENGKAKMKIKRLKKKLEKCSRNLTLSRELLKASKKKKFRNGGKQRGKPPTAYAHCYSRPVGSRGGFGKLDRKCKEKVDAFYKKIGVTLATKPPVGAPSYR